MKSILVSFYGKHCIVVVGIQFVPVGFTWKKNADREEYDRKTDVGMKYF